MVKRWVNLARVTPLMLGMIIFVPSVVVTSVVMAQSSPSSQQTEA